MEGDRWLRPNPWRYALPAGVVAVTLVGVPAVASFLWPADRVVAADQRVQGGRGLPGALCFRFRARLFL